MSMFSVGITATRGGLGNAQLSALSTLLLSFRQLGALGFHHGDCVGGDAQGATIAREYGYQIIGHPPVNDSLRAHFPCDLEYPARDYHDRNRVINNVADVLIGCPAEMQRRAGGTWWTINLARQTRSSYIPQARKPLIIIEPDGRLSA